MKPTPALALRFLISAWRSVFARSTLSALLLVPMAALHAAESVNIDLAKRTWQGIPGLERTTKGRVFVSWFLARPATIPRARAAETDQKAISYHLISSLWRRTP